MTSVNSEKASQQITEVVDQAWCRVLGRKRVPHDVSFIDLGGDSLLLIALLTALHDQLGVFLDAGDVLDDLTVDGIAGAVAQAQP